MRCGYAPTPQDPKPGTAARWARPGRRPGPLQASPGQGPAGSFQGSQAWARCLLPSEAELGEWPTLGLTPPSQAVTDVWGEVGETLGPV